MHVYNLCEICRVARGKRELPAARDWLQTGRMTDLRVGVKALVPALGPISNGSTSISTSASADIVRQRRVHGRTLMAK
jgi:hypothetical protein